MSCGAMIRTNVAVLSLAHEPDQGCRTGQRRIGARSGIAPCIRRRLWRTRRRWRERCAAWGRERGAARVPSFVAYHRGRARRGVLRLAGPVLLAGLLLRPRLLRTRLLLRL